MARILIYHHPADAQIVRQLIDQMAQAGCAATTDPAELSRDDQNCRIVLISNHTANDEKATFQTAIEALAHDPLLFVRVNSNKPPPFGFQDFKPLDIVYGPGDPSLDELIRRIKELLGGGAAEPDVGIPRQSLLADLMQGVLYIMRRFGSVLGRLIPPLGGLLRGLFYVLLTLLIAFALFMLLAWLFKTCREEAVLPEPSAQCRTLSADLYETDANLARLSERMKRLDSVIALQNRIDALQGQINSANVLARQYCERDPCLLLRETIYRRYAAYVRAYGPGAYTQYRRPTPDDPDAFLPFYDIPLDKLEAWQRELEAIYDNLELVETRPDGRASGAGRTCAGRLGARRSPGAGGPAAATLVCFYARNIDAEARSGDWQNILLRAGQSGPTICRRIQAQLRDLAAWIEAVKLQKSACEQPESGECGDMQGNIDQMQNDLTGLEVRKVMLAAGLPPGDPARLKARLEKEYNEMMEPRQALAEAVAQACTVEIEGTCGRIRRNLRPGRPPAASGELQPVPPARRQSFGAENTARLCAGPPKPPPPPLAGADGTLSTPDDKPEVTDSDAEATEPEDGSIWTFPLLPFLLILAALLLLFLIALILDQLWRRRPFSQGFTATSTVVSHAWEDLHQAGFIAAELRTMGFRVWIDQDGKYAGEGGARALAIAIKKAEVLTLMASQTAYRAQNVYREFHVALYWGKAVAAIRLDDSPVPPRYSAYVNDTCPLLTTDTKAGEIRPVLEALYRRLSGGT